MSIRCIACDGFVTRNKKKPVSTWTGELNSVYTDKVEDFPKEREDLCNKCIGSIRNINADLSYGNNHSVGDLFKSYLRDDDTKSADCYTEHLDNEFLQCENMYQGYESYEMLEGTSYNLGERDN